MSRAKRLLDLLQLLQRHRHPVTGQALADELGIHVRTLYRDIRALEAQGARIEGEAGLGYVLRPGFLLPPLMFSADELSALVLGMRWVAERGDATLSRAARDALAKVGAVLPPTLRAELDDNDGTLLIGPAPPDQRPPSLTRGEGELPRIRQAIRQERKLEIAYCDESGRESARTVWPIALAYFDHARVVVAHCELRQAFRHFRVDRIAHLTVLEARLPRRRRLLLAEWRTEQGIGG